MRWKSTILNHSKQTNKASNQKTNAGLESRIAIAMLLSISPCIAALLLLLWFGDFSVLLLVTVFPIALLSIAAGIFHIKQVLQKQFFGIANILECLRNGDFTMRALANNRNSAWGEVNAELNRLATTLHKQRVNAIESEIILDKLIEEFDVPLLVIDRGEALRHINSAGVGLFGKQQSELIGLSIGQLNLTKLMSAKTATVVEHQFPTRGGKWEVRRNIIRQHGSRFNLLLLNDLSRTLREEERLAWQKLIRVLGHELNNSLASITSVAETMSDHAVANKDPLLSKGLQVIIERGQGLQRFTEAYTSLAKLPQPKKQNVYLKTLLDRVRALTDQKVTFESCPDVELDVDIDQIEQLMLNLIKNALETTEQPKVIVKAELQKQGVVINILDNGHGISNPENLFVPFYTTKATGNGIGLYISRQIAEAHNGTLTLENRIDQQGCMVRVWLPVR